MLDRYLGFGQADPLFALAIASWLAWGAWRASRDAVNSLMDREWPDEKREQLIARVAAHPQVSRMHDLRTRTSGTHDFARFHVDLPPSMTVSEAHAILERIEADLQQAFPGIDVLIHVDPVGHLDEPGNLLAETNEFGRLGGRG